MVDLASEGHLAATARGLLYLDLDDRWVLNMQEELARFDKTFSNDQRMILCKRFGYQLPPYFYPPSPLGLLTTLIFILDVMIAISHRSAHHPAASDEARG